MDNCIFCKIIKGEIPSKKVYEDEHTYVFLDIAKDVDGHMLVIPKTHCVNILDAPADVLHHVMDTVQKVSNHLVKNCGYDGVNTFNCNNECASQSVFHFHMHIIPRKNNDKLAGWPPAFEGARDDLDLTLEKVKMM